MSNSIKIKTKDQGMEDEELTEPVSPSGLYFNSSVLSIYNLAILEAETPIVDDVPALKMVTDLFLPVNPRFSSIMVKDKTGVGKQWKKVKVKVEDHLKIPILPLDWSLEEYDKYFDDYLAKLSHEELPQDRPLWEIHLLKYPTTNAAGNLIFKLHQALGDGYSLVGALLSCFQRAEDPSLPLTFPTVDRRSSTRKSVYRKYLCSVTKSLSMVCYGLWDFGCSIKFSLFEDDKTPIRSGDLRLQSKPVRISSITFSLDQIKQIKVKLGVTVNDVIAGTVFLATRLYIQEKSQGSMRKTRTTALILLNVRDIRSYKSIEEMTKKNTRTPWGNHISLLHVTVPNLMLGHDDHSKSVSPLDFVYTARRIINRKRNSIAVYLTSWALATLQKIKGAEAVSAYIQKELSNTSFTITNVIGPVEKMALANIPVKGLYFTSVGVHQSLVVAVLSYMQTVRISLAVEECYIDRERLVHCMESAFQLILDAAMKRSN